MEGRKYKCHWLLPDTPGVFNYVIIVYNRKQYSLEEYVQGAFLSWWIKEMETAEGKQRSLVGLLFLLSTV